MKKIALVVFILIGLANYQYGMSLEQPLVNTLQNIDFNKEAPGKYQSKNYLESEEGSLYKDGAYVTKSGKEHVQDSLFAMADKKDY